MRVAGRSESSQPDGCRLAAPCPAGPYVAMKACTGPAIIIVHSTTVVRDTWNCSVVTSSRCPGIYTGVILPRDRCPVRRLDSAYAVEKGCRAGARNGLGGQPTHDVVAPGWVIPLAMVVRGELVSCSPEMPFREWNTAVQAFLLHRTGRTAPRRSGFPCCLDVVAPKLLRTVTLLRCEFATKLGDLGSVPVEDLRPQALP